jgi:site-specific DNA recombinase
MPENAVIYIRVSTEDQADSGLSLQSQEDVCRALAARKGWPVSSIWRDEGVSGSKPLDKRPGLFGAIGALGRGDLLVIAKRDRVFRTDDYDRAVILRAVGARERGAGIARTKAALQVKRDRGQRCGQIPYGWRLAADGVALEVDPADLGLVDACRRLRAEGVSLRAIGRELAARGFRPKGGGPVFGVTTIRRLLGDLPCKPES